MLSEKTISILEENDISIYDRGEQDGEYYREIEFYSDAGEDVFETIWYDGTDSGFIESFKRLANDFDVDEHAEMWIENRGNNGAPDSIKLLIDDAEGIKDTLLSVAEQLENINLKRTFTVTLTVSDNEEETTSDFEVEACSIEEAMENLLEQLDV